MFKNRKNIQLLIVSILIITSCSTSKEGKINRVIDTNIEKNFKEDQDQLKKYEVQETINTQDIVKNKENINDEKSFKKASRKSENILFPNLVKKKTNIKKVKRDVKKSKIAQNLKEKGSKVILPSVCNSSSNITNL